MICHEKPKVKTKQKETNVQRNEKSEKFKQNCVLYC